MRARTFNGGNVIRTCITRAEDITGRQDLTRSKVQVKSVHNTPIEGLWHWLSETCGLNMKDTIISGQTLGIYHSESPVHKHLFLWLWPKIVQNIINGFVQYWNNHIIRTQRAKENMSGSTPTHGFICPALPAKDVGIRVDQAVLDALRDEIPTSRAESTRWVSDNFAAAVYEFIGSPALDNMSKGWAIFTTMVPYLTIDDL
ncbi:hypothetical protein H1R20_g14435, partial [Candolleomyces eurysporus]